jgi:membrane protein implicated in regulation of membrane protease activity
MTPVETAAPVADFWSQLFVFVLASFIGLGVIRRVSRRSSARSS